MPFKGGGRRALWVPLHTSVAQVFGLAAGMAPDAAGELWPRARAEGSDPDPADLEHGQQDIDFLPDAAGYDVILADGVPTRVRFRRDPGEASGYEAEWLIANRGFAIPPGHSMETAAKRMFANFSVPHQQIDYTPKAKNPENHCRQASM